MANIFSVNDFAFDFTIWHNYTSFLYNSEDAVEDSKPYQAGRVKYLSCMQLINWTSVLFLID